MNETHRDNIKLAALALLAALLMFAVFAASLARTQFEPDCRAQGGHVVKPYNQPPLCVRDRDGVIVAAGMLGP